MNDKYVFFHLISEPNGWCSNWWPCRFKEDNIEFRNVEQYMMFHKAMLFKDTYIADFILKESDPAKIKQLGRMVKGYVDSKWAAERYNVVYQGNKLKFTQNEDLREKLLSKSGEFVECAINDLVWGIGLSMYDKKRFYKDLWVGSNLLGVILTQLRDEFKEMNL